MKSMTYCLYIFLILSKTLYSQPNYQFVRSYDSGLNLYDVFYDIYHNDDDSYTLCGWRQNQHPYTPYTDIWVVRVGDSGEIVWSETYGEPDHKEISSSVIQTDQGGFFIGGTRTIPDRFERPLNEDFIGLLLNAEGNEEWTRFYGAEDDADVCHAVIETKADNFLMAGYTYFQGGNRDGYIVCIDGNGDLNWDRHYGDGDERESFYGIRETEGGFVLAGRIGSNEYDIWIVKIDADGGEIWSQRYGGDSSEDCRVIVSSPGGFILGGSYSNNEDYDYWLQKINSAGQQQWLRSFDAEMDEEQVKFIGIEKVSDGGIALVGSFGSDDNQNRTTHALTIRTDAAGNEQWRRVDAFEEIQELNGGVPNFRSVVTNDIGAIVAAGIINYPDNRNDYDGLIAKLIPEISAPIIVSFAPERLEIEVLLADIIQFAVHAVDLQGDSVRYFWSLNGDALDPDTVSNDTSAIAIIFDELGDDTVQCTVSDGELADSIQWIVHVKELFIDTYNPDSLDIAIRRNTTVDFSLTTRATEGNQVEYVWLLDNEEVADNDSFSVTFERDRIHEVEAIAFRGEQWDNVIWQVTMMNMIVDFWPQQLYFEATTDTIIEFLIEPFNPQDASLNILWTANGDSIGNRTWAFIDFDSIGMQQVAVFVSDSVSSDSMSWTIQVNPNSVDHRDISLLPDIPTLYPPTPNPFNSQTTVRYALPVSGQVRLELFDINGRLITQLINQNQTTGWHDIVVDGSELLSGVYFIRMVTDKDYRVQKVLLLR